MNASPDGRIAIVPAPLSLLEAALTLALRPLGAGLCASSVGRLQSALARGAGRDECLRAAAAAVHGAGGDTPELFAAVAGGRVLGALWIESQPGRVAVFSRPQLEQAGAEVAVELLRAASQRVVAAGAVLLEALLEIDADVDFACFLEAGFSHACDLLYLVGKAKTFRLAPPPAAAELDFCTVQVQDDARLAEIVERTYQGTLDCPQLNGVRSAAEVIAGYQTIGAFSRERWFIVRRDSQDLGCLLLADHPALNHWELVYMGLVPEARGHGWGAAMTGYAQALTRRAGRERLVLAVDAANEPAVAMYRQAGLVAWDRRRALLRVLTSGASPD